MQQLTYDIETLPLRVEAQRYRRKAIHHYPRSLRSDSGYVDGHATFSCSDSRAHEWILSTGVEWNGGEHTGTAMQRAIELVGFDNVPDWLKYGDGSAVKNMHTSTSPYTPRRWHAHKPGGVIMAYAFRDFVHPTQPRNLTIREAGRVMGYPDDWSMLPIWDGSPGNNQKWLGKGISVPCGEWIGTWAKRALERNPGAWRGDLIDRKEWLIDITGDYRSVLNLKTGENCDARSSAQRREMEARPA